MLALTSTGRTFSYPLSRNANRYGQLGYRKFDNASPSSSSARVPVELVPKSVADPYAKASRFARATPSSQDEAAAEDSADESRVCCDRLFEVKSLKGIKVEQVVAGARGSFIRTQGEGRVLAWGANEYG
jgi:alpha-tubulin suppressor-like RCC1 family protein